MKRLLYTALCVVIFFLAISLTGPAAYAQGPISHQVTLRTGETWCDDSWIYSLLDAINNYRAQNGIAPLTLDRLGMKDAEVRALQVIDYLDAHPPGSPGFSPHDGYDTTASSLGYNIVGENLAWSLNPFGVWMGDSLHRAAMLATKANVAGLACVMTSVTAYWTYEPGYSTSAPTPTPTPTPTPPVLTTDEAAFLTLINNYRAQNGAGQLQVSLALENAARWMGSDMAAHNLTGHTDSLGRNTAARLAAFNYPYTPWGENTAGGMSDAQGVFSGWLNACDPDATGACTYAHRQNMQNGSFNVIGVARIYDPNSAYRWYWVTDFGGVVDQTISPTPGPGAPTISAFKATPTSVTVGQSSTLSWTVSGATTITIDNGVGDVSNLSSTVVSPQQTTTYKLTASNSGGSSTATAVVNVTATPDTQPPTVPQLVSAVAKSATMEVDLNWTASSDNVGVTGYQIFRNGSLLGSVGGGSLAYADTGVSANTAYTYAVKAYDAAGNYSGLSNSIQVTTPAAPAILTCPGPAIGAFTGCYYNNTELLGNPVLVRTDNQINFAWGTGSPASNVTPMNFSVRWQGMFPFSQGTYIFNATVSDGMRLYVDGMPLRSAWRDQLPNLYLVPVTLSEGSHLITLEYYEHSGTGTAILSWPSNTPTPGPGAPTISAFKATPTSVTVGQSSTLSWTVSGATTITIDNGVGDVSNLSSTVVSPQQTTTYKLTASNSGGSSTATAVVNVTATPDTQPPTVPQLVSAVAKSATMEVDLNWTASSDNVGVTGYQIFRNGSLLGSVGGGSLAYADTGVSANTAYTYAVKAYDAAGNYSGLSNSIQVTTPAAPAILTCPGPAIGAFTGCYYNNTELLGNPVLVRTDNQINFAWGTGSPASNVTPMNFSVRWQGMFPFSQGTYVFNATVSDGMRLYVDGMPLRSAWRDQLPNLYLVPVTLSEGSHLITLEYYEHSGTGTAILSWPSNTPTPGPGAPTISAFKATPSSVTVGAIQHFVLDGIRSDDHNNR